MQNSFKVSFFKKHISESMIYLTMLYAPFNPSSLRVLKRSNAYLLPSSVHGVYFGKDVALRKHL